MTDTVKVPRADLEKIDSFLHMLGVVYTHRIRSSIRAMLAAAPKVKQEPVLRGGKGLWPEHDPFLAHSAPASDELLGALEVIQDKLKFCTDEGPDGEGWLSKELEQAWSVVSNYINQHKGPQS